MHPDEDFGFDFCINLVSIIFPPNLTFLGNSAFARCGNLIAADFQGNAPVTGTGIFDSTAPLFSIYYPPTTMGWTTPTWRGYLCQPVQPILGIKAGDDGVRASFEGLRLGTNYQLQLSNDLNRWHDAGGAFTATNTSEVYPELFHFRDSAQCFFRLQNER